MKIDTGTEPDPRLNLPVDPPVSPPADDEHARAVRIRSYTTLTTGKDMHAQVAEKHGQHQHQQPNSSLDVDVVKFNDLFHRCSETGRRPADKVFMKSGLAFCDEAAKQHYTQNTDDNIALCYEISDYDECFWNFQEERFCTAEESEPYDEILEAVFETKGSYLDDPIISKKTEYAEVGEVKIATTSMQGWRIANEDSEYVAEVNGVVVTGIMDGHGGDRVAVFVKECLVEEVPLLLKRVEGGGEPGGELEKLFIKIDERVENELKPDHNGSMGTTMNLMILKPDEIIIANAGDSRVVLYSGGKTTRLTCDHKPTNFEEKNRIEKAGGHVAEDRVEGILAVSRALGDFDFKQAGSLPPQEQAVTAFPSVTKHPRDSVGPGGFILQACDGIFDCKTDDELGEIISTKLRAGEDPKDIVAHLCDACLSPSITESGIGTDNMSLHLIVF